MAMLGKGSSLPYPNFGAKFDKNVKATSPAPMPSVAPQAGSGQFYANMGSALSPSTKKAVTTAKTSQQLAAEKATAESLAVMKLKADADKANAKSGKSPTSLVVPSANTMEPVKKEMPVTDTSKPSAYQAFKEASGTTAGSEFREQMQDGSTPFAKGSVFNTQVAKPTYETFKNTNQMLETPGQVVQPSVTGAPTATAKEVPVINLTKEQLAGSTSAQPAQDVNKMRRTAIPKQSFTYNDYISLLDAIGDDKNLSPEEQTYLDNARQQIYASADLLDKEQLRAQAKIADRQAKGLDTTEQRNYLNMIAQKRLALQDKQPSGTPTSTPTVSAPTTTPSTESKPEGEPQPSLQDTYTGLATAQVDKQIADANAQLDNQIAVAESNRDFGLKSQLENYKQAINAMRDKAFVQEQSIGQAMANRGLLNSGMYADALVRSGISMNQNLRDLVAKQDIAAQKLNSTFQTASDKIDKAREKLQTNRQTDITKLTDSIKKESEAGAKDALKASLDMLQTLAKDNNLDISRYAPYMFVAASNPANASKVLADLANAMYNDPNPTLSVAGQKLVEQSNLIKKQQQEVDAKTAKLVAEKDTEYAKMTGIQYRNGVPVKGKDGKAVFTFDAQTAAQKALQKAQDSAETKAYRDQLVGLKGAAQNSKIQKDYDSLALKEATLNQRIKEFSVKSYKEGDKMKADFLVNYVTATGNNYRNAISEYNAVMQTKPDGSFVNGDTKEAEAIRTAASNKMIAAKIANEGAIESANDLLNTGKLTEGFDNAYSSFFGGGGKAPSKPIASSSASQGWSVPDYYTK